MRYMVHEAMSGRYPRTKGILMGRGSGDLDRDTNTITGEFESPAIINRRSGAVRNALRNGPDREAEGGPAIPPMPPATEGDGEFFPNGAPRAMKPKSMADDPSVPGVVMDRGRPAGRPDGGLRQERPWTMIPMPSSDPTEGIGSRASEGRRAEILSDPRDERHRPGGETVGDALMERFYPGAKRAGADGAQATGGAGGGKGTLHIRFDNAPAGMTHRAQTDGLFRETTVSKGRSQMDMDRA